MDDPIEMSNISVSANTRENGAVYEVLSQLRRQEDEYMTIGTAIKGDTIKHLDDQQRKIDKLEKTLGGLAKALKTLKLVSVILACTVVVISITFGVLINKQMTRTKEPDHESINGGWSSWSSWSSCSSSCGPGLSQRLRTCTNPIPAFNGKECYGDSIGTQQCQTTTCEVNGRWSSWSNWSSCSSTCGPGLSQRQRNCSKPIPVFSGRDCNGDSRDILLCETKTCAVHGGWSSWSSWSSCSSTCGPGLSQRQRNCSNPIPALNGRGCTADSTDKRLCETKTCAVSGGWSSWSSWSSCSSMCGPGLSQRLRNCSNPLPAFGGRDCTGDSTDKRLCETTTCAGLQIGFSASGNTLLSSSVVQFSSVKTNYGSGYSSSTGKFTCSHPGLYYFSTSLIKMRTTPKVDYIKCYMYKDDSMLIGTNTDPTDDDTDKGSYETSAFITVHLSRGDQVYVECPYGKLNVYSSFSGFLIQSE